MSQAFVDQEAAPARGGAGLSRRQFVGAAATALAGLGTGCVFGPGHGDGRIDARPGTPTQSAKLGLSALGLENDRDGAWYVPASYRADHPIPLLVFCHGAGGNGGATAAALGPYAEAGGFAVLAPDSRQSTWDLIDKGSFGDDVGFLDRALTRTFERLAVDPAGLILAGFSDGGTYALSLGITNGDFFGRLMAFSPGFVRYASRHGSPTIYLAHGTADTVLPIDVTSRAIVPELRGLGYEVEYREFDGGHQLYASEVQAAVDWLGLGGA
jgi:phospholipase/carboxylesterase